MTDSDAETRELAGDPHAQAAVRAGEQAMAAGDWTTVGTRDLDAMLAAWTARDLRAAVRAKGLRSRGRRTKRSLAVRLLANGVFTDDVRWLLP